MIAAAGPAEQSNVTLFPLDAPVRVLFPSVSVPPSVPVVVGLLTEGEVSVLLLSVSVVERNTKVSEASCSVQVRGAVVEPVRVWVKPP